MTDTSARAIDRFGGPLSRTKAVAEVARRILKQVSTGELGPGSRLPSERQLAERLGVGRSAIREAIAALDLFGIIETRQGAGSFIKASTLDLLPQAIEWGLMLGQPRTLDLVEARKHIEIVNAGLAAQRGTFGEGERLRRLYGDMVSQSSDSAAFVTSDVAFHLEIASLTGNSVLADILTSIRSLLQVWVARAAAGRESIDNTLEEHKLVMEAILSGDEAAAREAMETHMDRAGLRLQRSIVDSPMMEMDSTDGYPREGVR